MSFYRVCMKKTDHQDFIKDVKFDDKEDAEHYAKNQSVTDTVNYYEVQENNNGNFTRIKMYFSGKEVGAVT
jgi:hypothetical protein